MDSHFDRQCTLWACPLVKRLSHRRIWPGHFASGHGFLLWRHVYGASLAPKLALSGDAGSWFVGLFRILCLSLRVTVGYCWHSIPNYLFLLWVMSVEGLPAWGNGRNRKLVFRGS